VGRVNNPATVGGNLDVAVSTRYARPQAATFQNEGSGTNQGAGTVLVDTGALAAGEYEFEITVVATATGVTGQNGAMQVQHRNAANNANIRVVDLFTLLTNSATLQLVAATHIHWMRFTIAANERVRLLKANADAATGGTSWSLTIRPI